MRNCCELLGLIQPHKKTLTIGIDTDITRRCIPLGIDMYIGFEPRGFIAPRVCPLRLQQIHRSNGSNGKIQEKWICEPTEMDGSTHKQWLLAGQIQSWCFVVDILLKLPFGPYQIEKEYLWFMLHPDLFRVGEGNA